jgi:hypothetical protein
MLCAESAAYPAGSCFTTNNGQHHDHFSNLPLELTLKIMSCFSYDQIANLRSVSPAMNQICSARLNKGFKKMQARKSELHADIKQLLPRRDSKREQHPLVTHHRIMSRMVPEVELLSLAYGSNGGFIAGKVLDEGWRVLRVVHNSMTQPKPQPLSTDLLKELIELSKLARRHYKECIKPGLQPASASSSVKQSLFAGLVPDRSANVPNLFMAASQGAKEDSDSEKLQRRVTFLERELKTTQQQFKEQLDAQQKLFNKKMNEMNRVINELRKRPVSAWSTVDDVMDMQQDDTLQAEHDHDLNNNGAVQHQISIKTPRKRAGPSTHNHEYEKDSGSAKENKPRWM